MTRETVDKLASMLECSFPMNYMLKNHYALTGTLTRIFGKLEDKEVVDAFTDWINNNDNPPKFASIKAAIENKKNNLSAYFPFADDEGFIYASADCEKAIYCPDWDAEPEKYEIILRAKGIDPSKIRKNYTEPYIFPYPKIDFINNPDAMLDVFGITLEFLKNIPPEKE